MRGAAGRNPTSRKELGLTTAYTFNNLNQFASGSWTGKLTVIGEVNYAAGTVTVNGVTGRIFPDRVFEVTNITVSAGTNVLTAVYHGPAFTNTQMVATNTSTVIMATPVFGYDAKGNLTNDAEFVYQYDIANRLTNVVSKASGSSVLAARYDGLGRRIEVTRNGSTVERYVYFPGSFLVLAVLDGSNQLKEIYTQDPDLSGVVGGAGGIGGILSVTTNITDNTARKYFHADAMGNVVLVSGPDGKQIAGYGYTPFGKLVNQVGDFQARFLFSSKEEDAETRLVNFGLRFLIPRYGTWLTRDPLEESAGINLYSYVGNSPLDRIDPNGLREITIWAAAFISPASITFPYPLPDGAIRIAKWHGDGRGFGVIGGSSRVWHKVVIETDESVQKKPEISNDADTGITIVSYHRGGRSRVPVVVSGKAAAPRKASVTRTGPCSVRIQMSARVSNPLVSGSPPIDYSYTVEIDDTAGTITYSGRHDRYPWHELVVRSASATRQIVAASPSGPTKTPADLWNRLPQVNIPETKETLK